MSDPRDPENQLHQQQQQAASQHQSLGMLAQASLIHPTAPADPPPRRNAPLVWGPFPRSPVLPPARLPVRQVDNDIDLEDDVTSEDDWQRIMADPVTPTRVASQQTLQNLTQNFPPRHSTHTSSQRNTTVPRKSVNLLLSQNFLLSLLRSGIVIVHFHLAKNVKQHSPLCHLF
ncbi:hypothetical protein BDR26DRAFT_903318 [Obelidium mucronatum]|nr:hypothetical protein BDR26DRAFT_903318 [Obelidium mucronatum]